MSHLGCAHMSKMSRHGPRRDEKQPPPIETSSASCTLLFEARPGEQTSDDVLVDRLRLPVPDQGGVHGGFHGE